MVDKNRTIKAPPDELIDAIIASIDKSKIRSREEIRRHFHVSPASITRIGHMYRISQNEDYPEDLREYARELLELVRNGELYVSTADRYFKDYAFMKYGTVLNRKFKRTDKKAPLPKVPIKRYADSHQNGPDFYRRAYKRAIATLDGVLTGLDSMPEIHELIMQNEIDEWIDQLSRSRTKLIKHINRLRRKGAQSIEDPQDQAE